MLQQLQAFEQLLASVRFRPGLVVTLLVMSQDHGYIRVRIEEFDHY